MRMLEFKRTKLFDGVENELFNKEFLLNIEGKSLSFIADDITQFKLIDYQGKQEIIYELLLKSEGNSDIITKEGLQVYYLSKDDLLIVFSLGEYQSGRYMLFWKEYGKNKRHIFLSRGGIVLGLTVQDVSIFKHLHRGDVDKQSRCELHNISLAV